MQIFKEKTKRISFDISENEHYEIKMAAISRGLTIKQFIQNALKEYAKILKNKEEKI